MVAMFPTVFFKGFNVKLVRDLSVLILSDCGVLYSVTWVINNQSINKHFETSHSLPLGPVESLLRLKTLGKSMTKQKTFCGFANYNDLLQAVSGDAHCNPSYWGPSLSGYSGSV